VSTLFDFDFTNDLARQICREVKPLSARRDIGAGIASFIGGAILLTLGALCLYHFHRVGLAKLIGCGLTFGGLWCLCSALICFCDRSPMLVLDQHGLIHNGLLTGRREIAWSNMRRANLHRSLRNYSETSATLTLSLFEPVGGSREIAITVSGLDISSSTIFETVGKWANLS
jgi:hypothetical protein